MLAVAKEMLGIWRSHGDNLTYAQSGKFYIEAKEWIRKYEAIPEFLKVSGIIADFQKLHRKSRSYKTHFVGKKKKMAYFKIKSCVSRDFALYALMVCIIMPFSSYFIRGKVF